MVCNACTRGTRAGLCGNTWTLRHAARGAPHHTGGIFIPLRCHARFFVLLLHLLDAGGSDADGLLRVGATLPAALPVYCHAFARLLLLVMASSLWYIR